MHRLSNRADMFGMRFVPSKCKIPMGNGLTWRSLFFRENNLVSWTDLVALVVVSYLVFALRMMSLSTQKTLLVFTNLRQLWSRCGIWLLISDRLLHGRSKVDVAVRLRNTGVQNMCAKNFRVWPPLSSWFWQNMMENFVSNLETRREVLGPRV